MAGTLPRAVHFQFSNLITCGALLRRKHSRRVKQRSIHVASDAGRRGKIAQDLTQSCAAVDRCSAAKAHEEFRRPAGRRDELAEAATRSGNRIESTRIKRDRLRGFDRCDPVRQGKPKRLSDYSKRVVHIDPMPFAAERSVEDFERSLASIRDGHLDCFSPTRAHPSRERRGSFAAGEDSLQTGGCDKDSHDTKLSPSY